jgi:hypothetical protein
MRVDEVVGDDVVRLAMRIVGTAMSVPVVVGFVALGAAVLIGRSVWDRAPRVGPLRRGQPARRRRSDPPRRPESVAVPLPSVREVA